jgi:hypothetical protein
VFGAGSISKFLTMSELDWQNFKDSVDELRSTFPGLHQEPEAATQFCGPCSDQETGVVGPGSCTRLPFAQCGAPGEPC